MSVPKEDAERKSINDGTPQLSYLNEIIEFNLPSVKSMIDRINELGKGCLLFKRDLKGAFRQFSLDPGSYSYTGLS